jgi:hypothetical protein
MKIVKIFVHFSRKRPFIKLCPDRFHEIEFREDITARP